MIKHKKLRLKNNIKTKKTLIKLYIIKIYLIFLKLIKLK